MAIRYNKEHIKPDGRKLIRGGPRDLQRRQAQGPDQSIIVEQLREEIRRLSVTPSTVPIAEGFTGERVDEEIRKAVAVAIEEVQNTSKKREIELLDKIKVLEAANVEKLKSENEKITGLLEKQNSKIEELTYALQNAEARLELESDRPKMETTFIDPIERDTGKGLESHINIDDIKGINKEEMKSKVEKLKGLMGKLPNSD